MVESGRIVLGGDACGGLGGGTDEGGAGDGWDGDRDIINWWDDNVANIILLMELNSPLAYDMGLEIRDLIMSALGGHLGRLKRER